MSATIAVEPARVVLTLSFPDRRLSLNQIRTHPRVRDRLRDAYKMEAARQGQADIPAECRPVYPAGARLLVAIRCERARGGKVWDAAGIIEACKSAADGLNGILWHDDKQIAAWVVLWDTKPTGRGVIRISAHEIAEGELWAAVLG